MTTTALQIKPNLGQCALCRAPDKAHARRKFFDIHAATQSPLAAEALARIGSLYGIEEEIRGQRIEIRRQIRQPRAGPLLANLYRWFKATLTQLSTKSELAGAIRYAMSRWVALTRYRDDGRIDIDNNSAERSLRAVALGRKNYLFAGSNAGGERAAAIYTLQSQRCAPIALIPASPLCPLSVDTSG